MLTDENRIILKWNNDYNMNYVDNPLIFLLI